MIGKKRIFGDCLEALGIPDGGYAYIDRDAIARVFDVVWCSGVGGGEVGGFLKELIRTGDRPVVQTAYLDRKRNYMFAPAEIYGVVLRVTDLDGRIVWERPPETDLCEVVRCRECIHCGDGEEVNDLGHCYEINREVSPRGFCSFGERKVPTDGR